MKPMSIFYYYINNIKKILPVGLSVSLAVMFFYFLFLAGNQANDLNYAAHVKPYEYFTLIRHNGTISSDFIEEIYNSDSVERIIPLSKFPHTAMTSAIGNNSAGIMFLKAEDIADLIDIMGLSLKKGVMPKSDKEVLLHWRIAANKKLKIGDIFVDQNQLQGSYQVVGIYDGNCVLGFIPEEITGDGAYAWSEKNLILVPPKGGLNQMNEFLEKLPSKTNIEVASLPGIINEYKNTSRIIDRVMVLLIIIVIIVLCITLSNTSIMHFYQRKNEFSLLSIIGYTRWEIIKRIWLEEIFIYVSCFFLGIALSILCADLLNILVWNPMGETVRFWSKEGLLFTAVIPVVVIFLSVIPITRLLSKKDMVQIIEGR